MNRLWRAALLTGVAFAIPAAINTIIGRQRRELLNALPGDGGDYAWPMGHIYYQERGMGQPLVMIHGIGAGESSYEWRHNFDALSEQFHVYAFDLPGFGKSARRDVNYTSDLYVLAIMDFLRDVVKQPAYVMTSSLSGAYAVKLAAMRPELIERLVLVCPTGLETLNSRMPVVSQAAYGLFSLPAIGASVYNGIASYASIEAYMRENLYVDPTRVTPALVEHYYQSAHQQGAQYTLRSFLAGLLNCDINADYPRLEQQIMIVWGRHARMTPVENAQQFLKQNPNTRLRVFENSGLLPHDEERDDFNDAVAMFLNTKEAHNLLTVPATGLEPESAEHESMLERHRSNIDPAL
jgi:pimeloyl-ACP methyl ester carboxylesterase